MGKLTATAVKAAKTAGRYGDGDGLFLLVGKTGAKSWVVRVQKQGKRRDIGLGSAAKVPLVLARERAGQVRSQVEAGIDPVAERRKAAGIPTFRQAAALVHAETKASWRNGKHGKQWLSSLETHCFPKIGEFTVAELDGPAVRDVLAAIWLTKPETARRVRQRINAIVDWSVAKGYRDAPLPMAAIDKSLSRQKRRDNHHEAMRKTGWRAFPFTREGRPMFEKQSKNNQNAPKAAATAKGAGIAHVVTLAKAGAYARSPRPFKRNLVRAVGPAGRFIVAGQVAKALVALVKAGGDGVTALEVNSWAYRLGAYPHYTAAFRRFSNMALAAPHIMRCG